MLRPGAHSLKLLPRCKPTCVAAAVTVLRAVNTISHTSSLSNPRPSTQTSDTRSLSYNPEILLGRDRADNYCDTFRLHSNALLHSAVQPDGKERYGSPKHCNQSNGRCVSQPTTPPIRLMPRPRGRNSPTSQARWFLAASPAQTKPWRPGQPIVAGGEVARPGPVARRDLSTSTRTSAAAVAPVRASMTPPAAKLAPQTLAFRKAEGVVTRIPDNNVRSEAGRGDRVSRIRQITQDANRYFSQLQEEIEGLRLERIKRPRVELLEVQDIVSRILRCASALCSEADRTSGVLGDRIVTMEPRDESKGEPLATPASRQAEMANEKTKSVGIKIKSEPPYIPLSTFKIPAKILRAKMALADGDVGRMWNHTHYVNSEGKAVDVVYCKTLEECERVLPQFLAEKVVGFDMEWVYPQRSKTSIRQNVSFIQVASESTIALLHVGQMGFDDHGRPLDPSAALEDVTKLISPTLRQLIESDQVLKVGVNVLGDHRRLRDFLGVNPRGVFELSDLHNLVNSAKSGISKIPRKLVSLTRQTEMSLGFPLDKGPTRTSDWSQPVNSSQIIYAATDAYAALRIFDVLEIRRAALKPRPPLPGCRVLDQTPEGSGITASTTTTMTTASTSRTGIIGGKDQPVPSDGTTFAAITHAFSGEIARAGEWMAKYNSSLSRSVAANATTTSPVTKEELRAYALWHVSGLDIGGVAKICSDPPLKDSTVANYILNAIMNENLPFDNQRARAVLQYVPNSMKGKYKILSKKWGEEEKEARRMRDGDREESVRYPVHFER